MNPKPIGISPETSIYRYARAFMICSQTIITACTEMQSSVNVDPRFSCRNMRPAEALSPINMKYFTDNYVAEFNKRATIVFLSHFCSRRMSDNVGNGTAVSAVIENGVVAVGISSLSHSVAEIQCTSGLMSAVFDFCSRRMSGNVGSGIIGLPWSKLRG